MDGLVKQIFVTLDLWSSLAARFTARRNETPDGAKSKIDKFSKITSSRFHSGGQRVNVLLNKTERHFICHGKFESYSKRVL